MKTYFCCVLIAVLAPFVNGTIIQDSSTINGHAYVAWQAEDWTTNMTPYPDRRAWQNSDAAHFDAGPGYGGSYLITTTTAQEHESYKNYVTYDINFTVAGDYLLYQRIGAFNPSKEGSCDSVWFNDKTTGSNGVLINGSILAKNVVSDNQFGGDLLWKEWDWRFIAVGNKIRVTQADLDAAAGVYTFTFMMGAREGLMAFDAMVAVAGATGFDDVSKADLHNLFIPEPMTAVFFVLGGIALAKRRK